MQDRSKRWGIWGDLIWQTSSMQPPPTPRNSYKDAGFSESPSLNTCLAKNKLIFCSRNIIIINVENSCVVCGNNFFSVTFKVNTLNV